MSRREHQGERAALGDADDGRTLHLRGVHDSPDVIHPVVVLIGAWRRIGQTRAALVKGDHAGELAEPCHEVAEDVEGEEQVEVREDARDDDEVHRAFAEHPVGDVGVARLCVLRLTEVHDSG
jgi:hypothetical protein